MAENRTRDNPIKVLLIEDNPGDARLIQLTLADNKPQSIQLETVDRLSLGCKRLAEGGIDVVLLDLSLPDSQGFDTLAQVQATAPSVPVVVLTGLDNDEIGLEAVSKGAQDYLIKGQADRSLLTRALHYAIERKRAVVALREAEQHYRSLFEGMPVGLYRTAPDGRILDANSAMVRILGYPDREALMVQNVVALYTDPQDREIWRSLADSEEGEVDSEIQVIRHDGTVVWLRDTGHVVRDSKGEMLYYEGALEDVTERKLAEKALRESEEKFRATIEQSADGILIVDADFRIVEWSTAQTKIFGYTRDEMLGTYLWDYQYAIVPDEQKSPALLARLRAGSRDNVHPEALMEGALHDFEVQCKDGSRKTVQLSTFLVKTSSSTLYGASVRDITDRKHAEEVLRESEERYRLLIDKSPYGIVLHQDGKLFFANPAAAHLLGAKNAEELTGIPIIDIIHPDSREAAHDRMRRLLQGETVNPTEDLFVRLDGSVVPVEVIGVPFTHQGRPAIQVIALDVTERKRAEDTLKQRALQLLLINDISRRVASVMNLDELLNTTTSLIHESFGYEHVAIFIVDKQQTDELVMKARAGLYVSRFPPEHRLKLGQGMIGWVALYGKRLLANDVSTEIRFHDPFGDGTIKAELSVPIRSEQKVVGVIDIQSRQEDAFSENDIMVVETLVDVLSVAIRNARLYQELENYNQILEQAVQEATVEVRRTKERVGAILDNSPDAILLLRSNGAIESGNPAFQDLFGYHIDDLYGQLPTRLVEPGHMDVLQHALQDVIEKHERRRIETILQRLDGTTFDADIALAPTQSGHTLQGIVCSLRDITALKEVERMKDAFISNVSHELRTPITGIKLSHRLIEMDPGRQPVYMERMGREIERLHDIIENLLRLSRLDQGRVVLDIKPVDLNTLVVQYVGDRTPLAETRQLTLSLTEEPGLPLVQADEGLLGQVLSILLTNALTYTPIGGEVMVSAGKCETEGKLWVGFSVSDNGPGIPVEDLPHLGERFYRGKMGRDSGAPGTGLGLAIAREIVERHYGRLEISNNGLVGMGATFTVWLPMEPTGSRDSNAGDDA